MLGIKIIIIIKASLRLSYFTLYSLKYAVVISLLEIRAILLKPLVLLTWSIYFYFW